MKLYNPFQLYYCYYSIRSFQNPKNIWHSSLVSFLITSCVQHIIESHLKSWINKVQKLRVCLKNTCSSYPYIKEQRNIQGQKIHVMWSFFYFFNFALNCSSKRSIHIKLTLKFLIINKYNLLFINYNSITLKPQAVTIQQRNRNTHNLLKFQVLPWP